MSYLYGDATPFPLDENFIDTLSALTDTCVGLFKAEAAGAKRRQHIAAAQKLAATHLEQIQELGQAVQRTLTPFIQAGKGNPVGTAANQIGQAAQKALKAASEAVTGERERSIRTATSVDVSEDIRLACAPFALKHQLPDTSWGAEWIIEPGSEKPELILYGYGQGGINFTFRGAIPEGSMWATPLRVGDFASELNLTLSKEPGLLGKSTRKEALHRMLVTAVHYTPGQFRLTVRSSTKKSAGGLEIVIADGTKATPFVQQLGSDDKPEGKPEILSSADGNAVHKLWAAVEKHVDELTPMRASLLSVQLGRSTENCDQPQRLAEGMLAIVAPIVLEMRKRSRVPGELGLKRELGDGRREELFVSRAELAKKFADLPDHHRRVFEAMGLSAEPTTEFVNTLLPNPEQGAMNLEDALAEATKELVIDADDGLDD